MNFVNFSNDRFSEAVNATKDVETHLMQLTPENICNTKDLKKISNRDILRKCARILHNKAIEYPSLASTCANILMKLPRLNIIRETRAIAESLCENELEAITVSNAWMNAKSLVTYIAELFKRGLVGINIASQFLRAIYQKARKDEKLLEVLLAFLRQSSHYFIQNNYKLFPLEIFLFLSKHKDDKKQEPETRESIRKIIKIFQDAIAEKMGNDRLTNNTYNPEGPSQYDANEELSSNDKLERFKNILNKIPLENGKSEIEQLHICFKVDFVIDYLNVLVTSGIQNTASAQSIAKVYQIIEAIPSKLSQKVYLGKIIKRHIENARNLDEQIAIMTFTSYLCLESTSEKICDATVDLNIIIDIINIIGRHLIKGKIEENFLENISKYLKTRLPEIESEDLCQQMLTAIEILDDAKVDKKSDDDNNFPVASVKDIKKLLQQIDEFSYDEMNEIIKNIKIQNQKEIKKLAKYLINAAIDNECSSKYLKIAQIILTHLDSNESINFLEHLAKYAKKKLNVTDNQKTNSSLIKFIGEFYNRCWLTVDELSEIIDIWKDQWFRDAIQSKLFLELISTVALQVSRQGQGEKLLPYLQILEDKISSTTECRHHLILLEILELLQQITDKK